MHVRHNWSIEELEQLQSLPLIHLMAKAHQIHCQFHNLGEIQVCFLISIKTGGCPEDCKYCAQSSRYQTEIKPIPLMQYGDVMHEAKKAIYAGATRICLGAAWREVRNSSQFNEVIRMIQGISALGVEVCCTLGMLKQEQALQLKKAGLYAYNHNIDSSEEFYKTIITTRKYQDRLETLDIVQSANLSTCSGGIIGMGETSKDRLHMLLTLCNRTPHPDSFPINQLSPIPGTPLQEQAKLCFWEFVRTLAIARIVLPKSIIRLSAGRLEMSFEQQALCFFTGANSLFAGPKLLTVANTPVDKDEEMFRLLGLKKQAAFKRTTQP